MFRQATRVRPSAVIMPDSSPCEPRRRAREREFGQAHSQRSVRPSALRVAQRTPANAPVPERSAGRLRCRASVALQNRRAEAGGAGEPLASQPAQGVPNAEQILSSGSPWVSACRCDVSSGDLHPDTVCRGRRCAADRCSWHRPRHVWRSSRHQAPVEIGTRFQWQQGVYECRSRRETPTLAPAGGGAVTSPRPAAGRCGSAPRARPTRLRAATA